MAEKEERILVLKATEDDFIYKHFNGKGFISLQKAITRMAKAISKAFLDDKGNSQGATDKELAEAALNALLEK